MVRRFLGAFVALLLGWSMPALAHDKAQCTINLQSKALVPKQMRCGGYVVRARGYLAGNHSQVGWNEMVSLVETSGGRGLVTVLYLVDWETEFAIENRVGLRGRNRLNLVTHAANGQPAGFWNGELQTITLALAKEACHSAPCVIDVFEHPDRTGHWLELTISRR